MKRYKQSEQSPEIIEYKNKHNIYRYESSDKHMYLVGVHRLV